MISLQCHLDQSRNKDVSSQLWSTLLGQIRTTRWDRSSFPCLISDLSSKTCAIIHQNIIRSRSHDDGGYLRPWSFAVKSNTSPWFTSCGQWGDAACVHRGNHDIFSHIYSAIYSANGGLTLGQRLRRWPNINPPLSECIVFSWMSFFLITKGILRFTAVCLGRNKFREWAEVSHLIWTPLH